MRPLAQAPIVRVGTVEVTDPANPNSGVTVEGFHFAYLPPGTPPFAIIHGVQYLCGYTKMDLIEIAARPAEFEQPELDNGSGQPFEIDPTQ